MLGSMIFDMKIIEPKDFHIEIDIENGQVI